METTTTTILDPERDGTDRASSLSHALRHQKNIESFANEYGTLARTVHFSTSRSPCRPSPPATSTSTRTRAFSRATRHRARSRSTPRVSSPLARVLCPHTFGQTETQWIASPRSATARPHTRARERERERRDRRFDGDGDGDRARRRRTMESVGRTSRGADGDGTATGCPGAREFVGGGE